MRLTTLGANIPASLGGGFDPYGVKETTRFSIGYNDWGTKDPGTPQLGLGGDVNIVGAVKESAVIRPSEMIMLGDSKPGTATGGPTGNGEFDANIDPKDPDEWPSNRHNRRTNLMFADGHAELHKWLDARTRPPLVKDTMLSRSFDDAVPSPGNPDVQWLQERARIATSNRF